MKKITLGFAAAALLGLASFSVPAVAFQASMPGAAAASDAVTVQFRHDDHRVCKVRTVVTRGYHGRRVVKQVRVCR
jgi:putative lipase involved disintegration of autophagic bodies